MSDCKTIVTFNSGRIEMLNGDFVAELLEKNAVQKWQYMDVDE